MIGGIEASITNENLLHLVKQRTHHSIQLCQLLTPNHIWLFLQIIALHWSLGTHTSGNFKALALSRWADSGWLTGKLFWLLALCFGYFNIGFCHGRVPRITPLCHIQLQALFGGGREEEDFLCRRIGPGKDTFLVNAAQGLQQGNNHNCARINFNVEMWKEKQASS